MTYQVSKTTDQLREEYVAPNSVVLAFQIEEGIQASNQNSNQGDDSGEEEDPDLG